MTPNPPATGTKKAGNEPWKIGLLVVLALVAAVVVYMNVFAGDEPAPVAAARPASPVATDAPAPVVTTQAPASEANRRQPGRVSTGEFKPRLGVARPEDRPDPASIDPALRLDLLAKVQAVEPSPAQRNIFQYGAPPPPPAPPKPVEMPKNPPKIAVNTPPPAPPVTAPPVNTPPPAPQAPPMSFKYYGFKVSRKTGQREAFLLDGEDILIGGENQTLKGGRYRIVRISPGTIIIEDTQFKANQTLVIQEDAPPA